MTPEELTPEMLRALRSRTGLNEAKFARALKVQKALIMALEAGHLAADEAFAQRLTQWLNRPPYLKERG